MPLLSVREIAATKPYTIGRRGAYKDYIDLYFILSEQHATLTDIIDVAEKKFWRRIQFTPVWSRSYFSTTWKTPTSTFSKPPSRNRSSSTFSK
jgi:hypothetical protein